MYSHYEQLIKLGDAAIEPLVKMLSNPNAVIREYAADALGELKSAKAIDPLIAALNDSIARLEQIIEVKKVTRQ